MKGGSYLESEMTPFIEMRREYPLSVAGGSEQHDETIDFRVAIGVPSAPHSRYPKLLTQWQREGRLTALTDVINDAQNPIK